MADDRPPPSSWTTARIAALASVGAYLVSITGWAFDLSARNRLLEETVREAWKRIEELPQRREAEAWLESDNRRHAAHVRRFELVERRVDALEQRVGK